MFADALAKANEVNSSATVTQDDVDAALKALNDAIAALEVYVPPIDKTELAAAIADAAQYDEAKYTKASWAAFTDALAKANEVNEKADATQDEVNAALEALNAAIEGLEEYVAPDKTLLQDSYDYAKNLDTEGVTDSAKAYFEKVLANAKAVLDDPKATAEEVKAAWDNLLEGIWGLGVVQGDKAILEQLIAKADEMMENESKYVQTNWQQLVEALEAAKDVYHNGDA